MRSATILTALCALLPLVLAAPVPEYSRISNVQVVESEGEAHHISSSLLPTKCNQNGRDKMLSWMYGYASNTIGDERMKWIMVILGTSLPTCGGMAIKFEPLGVSIN